MSNGEKSQEEFLKQIENSNPEDAKKLIIESITPKCREVASKFFSCVETSLVGVNPNLSYQELDSHLNDHLVPKCMKDFDLESCLKKFENI